MFKVIKKLTSFVDMVAVLFAFTTETMAAKKSKTLKNMTRFRLSTLDEKTMRKHPIYKQQFGEFIPYMSILDLLFNEGPNSKNII